MPTFKQKNVIKSYKLRLQEKLKAVTEETENATSFLNNCVEEFRNRVQHILEIKDEKCLSLYRNLIRDLENYSEKLFILQASFEEATEEESDCSEDEQASAKLPKPQPKVSSLSSQTENLSHNPYLEENRHLQIYAEESVKNSCHDEDGSSITEDDFHSLHSDNNVENTNSCTLFNSQLHGYTNELVSGNRHASNLSASQSSCYRSISSNISESLTFHTENKSSQSAETHSLESKNECPLKSSKPTLVIHPTDFEVSSRFSATLSCIIDPGNFWILLENSHGSKLSFPKTEYAHLNSLPAIEKGSYCLAPFKLTPFYYRAQALSDGNSGKEFIKVLFIDHGSTQEFLLCDLRPLPKSAYKISAQAIHCYLHGIIPISNSWSHECTKRFKEFKEFCIETIVKSRGSSYGVQLIATLSAELKEDYSVDINQDLCLDGYAISINESPSANVNHGQGFGFELSKPGGSKTDSTLEVSGSYDVNAISSDSGVSVTSAYKSSQISNKRNENFHKVSEHYISSVAVKSTVVSRDFKENLQMTDLILFDSSDALNDFQNSNDALKSNNKSLSSCCLICRNKSFCLHFKVPLPSLLFVEKNMMIVMLSHIVNPQEFYVNMAMENIVSLDDLREQMTCTYESEKHLHQVQISDVTENMFCAGRFNADDYWYRVKIIRISPEDKQKNQVLGQYIDYGNTATIQCCDLRPLTSEFSKHPSFSIKCSLAGITPIKEGKCSNYSSYWDDDAINAFKKLTSFERCLTAQICNEFCNNQNDIYPVLLWDTKDSNDLLINASLADQKVALFDYSLIDPSLSNNKAEVSYIDIDSWDPMLEEYNDTHNNYAVDDEELEVITTGYKAKDEKYSCKYFSLHGHCPRGLNCPYEHLPLLESGVTHDQEEVYCLDTVPIIPETMNKILVRVSSIINPAHFYVILPFGCKTVDDIDNLVYKGSPVNEITNSEATSLFYAIDKHYSNTPFKENTLIALSCGTIVVAKRKWDDKWHRGRIVDVVDINKPAKVFFVDSGDHEWVSRKYIRTILPQFLHTPFQAVHCSLYGIEPIGSERELSWTSEAINYFKDIVDREVLIAEIVHRFGRIFHVSLRKTSRNTNQNLSQLLVFSGFAQHQKIISSKKQETIYVPG